MPDAPTQSNATPPKLVPELGILLRLGAFLPVIAGFMAFGLVLVSGHRHKTSQPEPPKPQRQSSPIQLVSAVQEKPSPADANLSAAAAPLTAAAGSALEQTPQQEGVVRTIPDWKPDVSLTAQPQSVTALVSDAEGKVPSGIRRTNAQQEGATDGQSAEPRIVQFTLAQVDSQIEAGRFSFAQGILRDVHHSATSLLKIQIELRLALCAELLGQPKEALKYYRLVMQTPLSAGLADAATLSAARVLIDQKKHDLSSSILSRLLIQREQLMATEQRGELMHALASCLTPDSTQSSLLHPSGWVIPRATQTPVKLMQSWDNIAKDTTQLAQQDAELTVRRLTSSADGIYVTCHHASVSVLSVIESVTKAAELRISIDPDTTQILSERTSPIACREFPLDVFLDSLCMPLQIHWTVDEGVLTLAMKSTGTATKKTARYQTAQRFLRLAVTMAPEHPHAALSYLYLGVTYAELGRVDRAVRYFRTSMEQYPRSNVRAAARFNLGKASLANGDRTEALQEFYRTVDQVAGPEIDAAAYMFVGRILMENDLPRDAVTPLARGVAFATGSHHEADAVVLLASAYVLHGQMEAANTVLNDHSEALRALKADAANLPPEKRHLVKQASMLGSLARFWDSRGSMRMREGTKLISSLAGIRLDLMFGEHNAFLVGAAYGAIGMERDRDQIFEAALKVRPEFPLQNRMKLVLTGRSSVDEWLQKETGKPVFSAADRRRSVETVPALVDLKARFSEAEKAYREGRFEECLKACEGIHQSLNDLPPELIGTESENAIRRETLQLLGKSHQALGNHAQAIRYLTGVADIPVPAKDDSQRKQTAKQTRSEGRME